MKRRAIYLLLGLTVLFSGRSKAIMFDEDECVCSHKNKWVCQTFQTKGMILKRLSELDNKINSEWQSDPETERLIREFAKSHKISDPRPKNSLFLKTLFPEEELFDIVSGQIDKCERS